MAERGQCDQRTKEGGVTTAPGVKMTKITKDELRSLRNAVPVRAVLESLGVAQHQRGQRREFRCPECDGFHVAIHRRENLARCFRCAKSYNPIDLVMSSGGAGFLDAVEIVRGFAVEANRRTPERDRRSEDPAK